MSNTQVQVSHRSHVCPCNVPFDFRPIRIHVYKNGNEKDAGRTIHVTRRQFRHWIVFLDFLTKYLRTTTAVNRLYSIDGRPINHFEDLEPNGEYVAAERGSFVACNYGALAEKLRNKETRFAIPAGAPLPAKSRFLNDADGVDIFLKKQGFGSRTGLPYPLDGVERSTSSSFLHSCSARRDGSPERLDDAGRAMHWQREADSARPSSKSQPDLRIDLDALQLEEHEAGGSQAAAGQQTPSVAQTQPDTRAPTEDNNVVTIRITVPQAGKDPPSAEPRPTSRCAETQTDAAEFLRADDAAQRTPKKAPTPKPPSKSEHTPLQRPRVANCAKTAAQHNANGKGEQLQRKTAIPRSKSQPERRKKRATWFSEDFDDPDIDELCLPAITRNNFEFYENPHKSRRNVVFIEQRTTKVRTSRNLSYQPWHRRYYDPDFDDM